MIPGAADRVAQSHRLRADLDALYLAGRLGPCQSAVVHIAPHDRLLPSQLQRLAVFGWRLFERMLLPDDSETYTFVWSPQFPDEYAKTRAVS